MRLQQLLQFLQEEPNDPFLMYAVAQEYHGTEPEKALAYYRTLLAQHPGYTATYYHAALLMAELGLNEEAETVFLQGIAQCKAKNEAKALRELQTAYQNFLFEQE
jgi:hypothetical protein